MATSTVYGWRRTALMLAICAALSACAQIQGGKDDMLIGAGFTPVPANTPQRQAALASIPPHTFVHEMHGGRVLYAYADPTACGCLYIGTQAAYDRYRDQVSLAELSNVRQMNDEMYHMDWDSWGAGWQ
jgi:hypothetical protein